VEHLRWDADGIIQSRRDKASVESGAWRRWLLLCRQQSRADLLRNLDRFDLVIPGCTRQHTAVSRPCATGVPSCVDSNEYVRDMLPRAPRPPQYRPRPRSEPGAENRKPSTHAGTRSRWVRTLSGWELACQGETLPTFVESNATATTTIQFYCFVRVALLDGLRRRLAGEGGQVLSNRTRRSAGASGWSVRAA
jgi:hypothetical protein